MCTTDRHELRSGTVVRAAPRAPVPAEPPAAADVVGLAVAARVAGWLALLGGAAELAAAPQPASAIAAAVTPAAIRVTFLVAQDWAVSTLPE
jgi:hypothetical protein